MINDFWTAWWLFGGLVEGLIFFWPVSLLLGIHAAAAIARSSWVVRNPRMLFALAAPFIWPALILLISAAWRSAGPGRAIVPLVTVAALFVIQIILSAGIVYLRQQGRWAVVATSLLAGWCGALSLFVAKTALAPIVT